MGRKPSKTAIGAFVIGGVILFTATLLIFGAGKFFTTRYVFITYFSGSVKGLAVGSPVMFRGVKVGSVSDISIVVGPSARNVKIPVVFTIEPAKLGDSESAITRNPKAAIRQAVNQGLRTQLQMLSFLTGQLMVSLDFFPGKPARFERLQHDYPEIPSVPTPLEELQKTFETLPLKEMVANLSGALAGIHRILQTIDAKGATEDLHATVGDVRELVQHVDAQIKPLMAQLRRTAGSAESTLGETKETMAAARAGIKELTAAVKGPLESAQGVLTQSEKTLKSYSADPGLAYELKETLRELSATARSLRQLTDYLELHPESLLRGKQRDKRE